MALLIRTFSQKPEVVTSWQFRPHHPFTASRGPFAKFCMSGLLICGFLFTSFSTFNVNSLCVHAVNGWRYQPGTTKTFIRFLQCFSPRLTSSLHAYVLLCIFLLWFVFFVIYVTNSGLHSAVPLGPQFLHA